MPTYKLTCRAEVLTLVGSDDGLIYKLIMSGQVDEIKARVDIVDLVGEYIRLKPAGPNNWRALCPFHNEKTPSFMVSRDKQIWHCFGCSEGGDIFSFVQKMENVEFIEALKILAGKAGVKLISENPELTSQRNRLLDVTQAAASFWHKVLLESPAAQKARDYLKKRQVSEQIIADFKIGYAIESWDSLVKFLKSSPGGEAGRKFSDQEIFLAGLSVKKERGQDFYDRFRDRLMFPINDLHGNPVGFSGRTLNPNEKAGKYINTPQTLIYNKSLVLFNLDKAKSEIKKQDLAILVEGQMDVLAAVQARLPAPDATDIGGQAGLPALDFSGQAGLPALDFSGQAGTQNVIASSGTALTLDQLKILKRYTKNLAIAFDTDIAGESAAKRGIDLALSEEMNVKVIVIPEGKDPDDCIKKNPADWFDAVKNAKSIMEYYFEKTFAKVDLAKAEGKKEAAKILLPIIVKIGNQIEQTHWLQKLGEALNVSEQILRESLVRPADSQKQNLSATPAKVTLDRNSMLAEQVLAITLKNPNNLSYLIDNLPPEIITDDKLNQLYKNLIIYYTEDIGNNTQAFDYQKFHSKLKPENLEVLADKLVLLAEKDFFDFDPEIIKEEVAKIVKFCKKNYYALQLKAIEQSLRAAEVKNQKEEVKKLMQNFSEVMTQLKFLD
ncbi:MAG: DNA primase [Patescibacteria group bacterium]